MIESTENALMNYVIYSYIKIKRDAKWLGMWKGHHLSIRGFLFSVSKNDIKKGNWS